MKDPRHDLTQPHDSISGVESDSEIVDRVVRGDDALFELLMRRHNRRVFRTVLAVLGSEDEVEDVMQQTYVAAFRHLDQFRRDAAFATWLTRIAVNEATRHRKRSERGLRAATADERLEIRDDRCRTPEETVMGEELRRILEAELLSLPAAYREVIVLRDVEGLSSAETAETLELTDGVVRTRLHRARAMLRDGLIAKGTEGLRSAWPFAGERCDRVVGAVMSTISNLRKGDRTDE